MYDTYCIDVIGAERLQVKLHNFMKSQRDRLTSECVECICGISAGEK